MTAPPRPEGYVPPPRAPLGAALATAVAGARFAAPLLLRMAWHRVVPQPSSSSQEGLARFRAASQPALARLGVTLEVRHADRVPREGGVVLMWNQASHLDHLVLPTVIPRPFFSLLNNAFARTPIYGRYMTTSGHVHVDARDEAQWRPAVAGAAERVRRGECVLVSPEGTRSWDGRLLPMKRGAFLLAIASGRPIVCVTLAGAHARLPRGSAVVRPGPVRVTFSEPIPTAGHDPERRGALEAQVVAAFSAALADPPP